MMSDSPASTPIPIGVQIGSGTNRPLTSANHPLSATNDGAHTGTTPRPPRRKQRRTPRDIAELAAWLSDRDFAILRTVKEHQFITAGQIDTLHFANHTPQSGSRIARRVLARLRDYRLLGMFGRRIGGVRAGSTGAVHYLDVVGQRLLDGRSGRRRGGFREPTPRFVDHRIAIADAHLAIVQAHRRGEIELVVCTLEPNSWRRYPGLAGAHLVVKPDLYTEVAITPGSDFVTPWFIEVDRSTESIPALLRKCHAYEDYRRSGTEQSDGGGFPRVVWSITHADPSKAEQRRQALIAAIAADRTLPTELFRIIAPDEIVPLLGSGGAP